VTGLREKFNKGTLHTYCRNRFIRHWLSKLCVVCRLIPGPHASQLFHRLRRWLLVTLFQYRWFIAQTPCGGQRASPTLCDVTVLYSRSNSSSNRSQDFKVHKVSKKILFSLLVYLFQHNFKNTFIKRPVPWFLSRVLNTRGHFRTHCFIKTVVIQSREKLWSNNLWVFIAFDL
jgi:hypothetical protein